MSSALTRSSDYRKSPAVGLLILQALDALEAEGFCFWLLTVCDGDPEAKAVDDLSVVVADQSDNGLLGLSVVFSDLPANLPVLPAELELLLQALDDIRLFAFADDLLPGNLPSEAGAEDLACLPLSSTVAHRR